MLGLGLGSFGDGDDFVIPIFAISYLEMGLESGDVLITFSWYVLSMACFCFF